MWASLLEIHIGLDAELKEKREASYDKRLEQQAQRWIEAVIGEKFPADFHTSLKDGIILCKYVVIAYVDFSKLLVTECGSQL
jgi:hypothetical protein